MGKYGLGKYSTIVGTVGRIKPVKDFVTLIKAFNIVRIKHKDSALVIVGPGNDTGNSYYIKLTTFLQELGLSEVFFLGTHQNIPEILSIFDVFVNSSLSEGISNTILESMANKVPVVATNVGGNPELIEHGKSGLLFESEDEEGCAECILKILDDVAAKEFYVNSAYQHVKDNHTMESMYQTNTHLYQKLLRNKLNYQFNS